MRILLDTNILLDILEMRKPFVHTSGAALERCQVNGFSLYLAWHSLANCIYIYGRKAGRIQAEQALRDLLEAMEVATVGNEEARRAFTLGFVDMEDALQAVAAEACLADFILTRNLTDFVRSPVPVLSPEQFLRKFPVRNTDV